jgi:chromatin remodeling complex protein RSC6
MVVIPQARIQGSDYHERRRQMAKAKKAAFGGYSISFKGCSDSLEAVFGSAPIGPPEMTKKIWAYVKRRKLGKK